MDEKEKKPVAPPAPPCSVCSKRTAMECSHVNCPNRRRETAGLVGGYEPMGGGCFRRSPTCRE